MLVPSCTAPGTMGWDTYVEIAMRSDALQSNLVVLVMEAAGEECVVVDATREAKKVKMKVITNVDIEPTNPCIRNVTIFPKSKNKYLTTKIESFIAVIMEHTE